jgi:probable F420-dependent oxidoreductase
MQINVTLPFDQIDDGEEFLTPAAVAAVGAALERAGFDGANLTDHPCPTAKWLEAGGHYAQDPFVMLALLAGATTRLRLQTGILVLPYRNPFITARAVATLDVFSRGRVTLGIGTGYLKGEYFATGANFESRNDIVDEYIRAMKAAWTGADFSFKGTGYDARDCRILPAPRQKPHPPLLIGGNSQRAIRRAVELGDAWYPFPTTAQVSATSRTALISTEADVAQGIQRLHKLCEQQGRSTPPDVILAGLPTSGEASSPQATVDQIARLEAMGVAGIAIAVQGRTRAEWCDEAERVGAEVIRPLRGAGA